MGDVLIDILRGKTEEEITDYIVTFKKDMVNRDTVDLAKNSSVKNLSKFRPKTKKGETPQLFQFVKGAPAHVKAAITYNDLLKHFNAPFKYEPMKDGDKIKWIYLKNNPLGLDGVAFWGHSDPPEIENFVKTYTDHNKIFERELKGKLQDFYDAIGWGDIMSEQKTAEKFFSF